MQSSPSHGVQVLLAEFVTGGKSGGRYLYHEEMMPEEANCLLVRERRDSNLVPRAIVGLEVSRKKIGNLKTDGAGNRCHATPGEAL